MHSPHQPALHGERPANFVCGCCFAARPANCWLFVTLRPVPGGESAGCVLVQQAVCLLAFAMPTAHLILPPFSLFCFAPCSFHVRQDRTNKFTSNMFASCKTVPLAATTRVCSGGPRAVLHPPPIHCAICANTETAFGQPMRRCSLHRKKGRPRTACGQPAKFPTPAFCEPETACEQPGSLLTVFSFLQSSLILGHG